jgi:urease accessory protein
MSLPRFTDHIRRSRTFGRISPQNIRPRHILTALAVLSSLAAFASPASAHSGTGLVGGFISGFLHPVTGWDHLLAMVSVGLWGAVLGRPLIVALPVIFPVLMVVGAFLGMVNVPLPPVELGIALSVLILGGVIAAGYKAPVWLACTVVAIFAVFHGYAHGKELPSAADPIGYSTGFVLSTGLLHVGGIVIGLLNDSEKGKWIVRGIGAAIAAAGCFFVVQAFSGA